MMKNQLITLTKEFKNAAYYIAQQRYDLNPPITQRYTLGGSRRLYGSMDAQGAVRGAPAADVDPPSGYPRHRALKRGHDTYAIVVPGLPA